jgi:quercetin dioxygenase-like cupin family protein
MQHWDLTATHEGGRAGPRVLFSTPEARGVVIDLEQDEELGDHQVRERALLHVLRGTVTVRGEDTTTACPAGSLVVFEPGEPHAVQALAPARLLLVLAPWPAPGHYDPTADEDPHALPANATQLPREPASGEPPTAL